MNMFLLLFYYIVFELNCILAYIPNSPHPILSGGNFYSSHPKAQNREDQREVKKVNRSPKKSKPELLFFLPLAVIKQN